MMLALVISYVDRSAHIYIMNGLYYVDTFFAGESIDNHHIFTIRRIFKPFTSNKTTNLSSSRIVLLDDKSKNIP
jgi:hypothetical protein